MRGRTSRALAVLLLASRGLLAESASAAGDVRASVDRRGNLTLEGDRLGNDVTIAPAGATANEVRVSGASGTLVNGASEVVLVATARLMPSSTGIVANDLVVRTRGGDDFVELSQVQVGGSLVISLGAEDDQLEISCTFVLGAARLRGGSGRDVFTQDLDLPIGIPDPDETGFESSESGPFVCPV